MKTYHWFFFVIAILMWNGMMIKRDQKMFDAYDRMNAKEHYCSQLKTWHPDCKIE